MPSPEYAGYDDTERYIADQLAAKALTMAFQANRARNLGDTERYEGLVALAGVSLGYNQLPAHSPVLTDPFPDISI